MNSVTRVPRRGGAAPLALDSVQFIEQIQNQAQLAVDEADAVVFVVDGREGLTAVDSDIADILRVTEKPVFVAVNKAEGDRQKLNAVEFWNLGLGEPFAISAYHGAGVGDLLDELVAGIPPFPVEDEEDEVDPDSVAIAIVGRPNVGKSSLLNTLIGMDRAIVSEVPGTTRDPIDMEMVYDGRSITLIDTAGIRRRGKVEPGIEKYSVLRSMRSIDRADVALLLIDAIDGVTSQDTHVAGYVLEKMKGVVVLVNKWDALEKDSYTMNSYTETLREELKFMDYVPVLYISAKTRATRLLCTAYCDRGRQCPPPAHSHRRTEPVHSRRIRGHLAADQRRASAPYILRHAGPGFAAHICALCQRPGLSALLV